MEKVNSTTPKASKAAKLKKAAPKESLHPPTSVMVNNAISSLKERTGSSLQAIKKYVAATYKVDPVKYGPFIRKALKSGVEKKTLVQVKGTGASGSFKMAKTVEKAKKKPEKAKKTKPAAKKKASKPKKKAVKTPKKKVAKKGAKPKKPIAKKTAKPAAKKPAKKAPKKK